MAHQGDAFFEQAFGVIDIENDFAAFDTSAEADEDFFAFAGEVSEFGNLLFQYRFARRFLQLFVQFCLAGENAGHGEFVDGADGNRGFLAQLFVLQKADARIKRQQVFGNVDEVDVFVIVQPADEDDGKNFAEIVPAVVFLDGAAQHIGVFVGGAAFGQVIGGYENVGHGRKLRQAGIQQRKYFILKTAVAAEMRIAERLAHIVDGFGAGRQQQAFFGRECGFRIFVDGIQRAEKLVAASHIRSVDGKSQKRVFFHTGTPL